MPDLHPAREPSAEELRYAITDKAVRHQQELVSSAPQLRSLQLGQRARHQAESWSRLLCTSARVPLKESALPSASRALYQLDYKTNSADGERGFLNMMLKSESAPRLHGAGFRPGMISFNHDVFFCHLSAGSVKCFCSSRDTITLHPLLPWCTAAA